MIIHFAKALDDLKDIDIANSPISNAEKNYVLLKKLEVLGLIKFEEEKKKLYLNDIEVGKTCELEIVQNGNKIRMTCKLYGVRVLE